MNTKKVVRKKGNKYFVLVDESIQNYFGKLYKNTYWLESDADGNVSDGNHDGVLESMNLLCRIPDGKIDIDVSTLSEDCLIKK